MGGVMFFLLRMAFWLCVVCVLLPSIGSQSNDPDTQIDPKQAVTLASAAVTDARGFCDRQPDACQVGGSLVVALGHKAEAGARTELPCPENDDLVIASVPAVFDDLWAVVQPDAA